MSRLPTESINIPSVEYAAGGIVMVAFRRNGIDPRKAAQNLACVGVARSLAVGDLDHESFDACCAKLLLLAPDLRVE